MSNAYATTQVNSTTTNLPVHRPISWLAVLLQLGVATLVIGAFSVWLGYPNGSAIGVGLYLLYSFGSRRVLLRAHRRGMHLNSVARYEDAITAFDRSYQFFSRYPWLDRYRAITMLNSAALSYREMALCNMAYSYLQLGLGLKAKASYQRALAEFPQSALAMASLRMMATVEAIGNPQSAAT
jgi:tetratricopeptide (TPR) repeat protein